MLSTIKLFYSFHLIFDVRKCVSSQQLPTHPLAVY